MRRIAVLAALVGFWTSIALGEGPSDSQEAKLTIEASEHLSDALKEELIRASDKDTLQQAERTTAVARPPLTPFLFELKEARGEAQAQERLVAANTLEMLEREDFSAFQALKAVGPDVLEVAGPDSQAASKVVGAKAEVAPPFNETVVLGSHNKWFCTGVAISDRAILTAGHCAHAKHVGVGYRVNTLRELHRVARARIAPQGMDAAVLFLQTPVREALPSISLRRDSTPPRGFLTVVGFGSNRYDAIGGSGAMRSVDIVAYDWGCDPSRASVFGCRHGKEFLLRSVRGNDTCAGDSGGPVYESTDAGRVLVGITSRPVPLPGAKCGNGGIYTRVDALAVWLFQLGSEQRKAKRRQR